MNLASVARRHRSRPGFHLVDFAEVGLPVYSLSLRVITLGHKKVSPIEEFVLRSIAAGMSKQDDISSFLGLQASVVRAALVSLAQVESIALAGLPGTRSQSLLITPKGRTVLDAAETVVPEERSITLHFDGLLRSVQLLGWTEVLPPKEIRDRGLREIPAFPARKPIVSDLKFPDVEQVIRSMGNVGDHRRDLLAIRGIERATRLFREAVMLLYVADHDREIQVGFAIDGKLSEAHERAFAIGGGARKTGLANLQLAIPDPREWGEVGAALSAEATSGERIDTIQSELTRAESSVQDVLRQIKLCESLSDRLILSAQLEEARLLASEKQRELDRLNVRELNCYDFEPLFEEALRSVKSNLVIVSPGGVTAKVVNREFVKRLDELAGAGVRISIHIGMLEESRGPKNRAAEENLRDLASKHSRISVEPIVGMDRSILAVDETFAAVSTFNWLGHSGNSSRPFVCHGGVVIRISEEVNRIVRPYIGSFNEAK